MLPETHPPEAGLHLVFCRLKYSDLRLGVAVAQQNSGTPAGRGDIQLVQPLKAPAPNPDKDRLDGLRPGAP
jgi:hypothetical protein